MIYKELGTNKRGFEFAQILEIQVLTSPISNV